MRVRLEALAVAALHGGYSGRIKADPDFVSRAIFEWWWGHRGNRARIPPYRPAAWGRTDGRTRGGAAAPGRRSVGGGPSPKASALGSPACPYNIPIRSVPKSTEQARAPAIGAAAGKAVTAARHHPPIPLALPPAFHHTSTHALFTAPATKSLNPISRDGCQQGGVNPNGQPKDVWCTFSDQVGGLKLGDADRGCWARACVFSRG